MFTVKLMTGQPGQTIKIVEAREVEIKALQGINACGEHAIVVKPGPEGMDDFWYYVGHDSPDQYQVAVIENAAGKTTEVVRASKPSDIRAA